jgi:hypothetical protein
LGAHFFQRGHFDIEHLAGLGQMTHAERMLGSGAVFNLLICIPSSRPRNNSEKFEDEDDYERLSRTNTRKLTGEARSRNPDSWYPLGYWSGQKILPARRKVGEKHQTTNRGS